MRYLDYIGLLGSLWLLIDSIRKKRDPRDWRRRGQALLGTVGIAYGVVDLYGDLHREILCGTRTSIMRFYSSEGVLLGALVGIFISLCLAGWFKDYLGRNREETRLR
jgi:hypothetical protein